MRTERDSAASDLGFRPLVGIFAQRGKRQPAWSGELMAEYY
ncbi:MAG TPA: hypothetical protein VFV01_40810 [Spirillospora sp.]|nr:hypothetical protein [Spirillospora sp.]